MKRLALAASAVALLAPFAAAQFQPPPPQPLPGMPMVPPPVPHPGLAAQPLFGDTAPPAAPAPAPAPGAQPERPAADPATFGTKLEGKELKRAVARVAALRWHEDLLEARAMSAATGKPVLWLQALGDIDGFA
jgi:hypothetical protein